MASSVKNIVKVMNFHSLIRVDKAKRKAAKFQQVEVELEKALASIVYNRNLKLDKKMLVENPNGVVLNIYIGNDLGFCGNFNHQVQNSLKLDDHDAYKIVIGKKIKKVNDERILLNMTKEEFFHDYYKINDIVSSYIREHKVKEINVILNYYHSVSEIAFEKRKLFPIEVSEDLLKDVDDTGDYVIETDINSLVANIISLGICYKIKIYESNSWASENVMRERVTRDSIKKIEEIETEELRIARKEAKEKAFKKQISNYRTIS